MPRLNKYQVFKPENDFLAFPDHYVNIVGFIEYEDLEDLAVLDASGKLVIKRGTVINIDADGKVTAAVAPEEESGSEASAQTEGEETEGEEASGEEEVVVANGNGIIFDTIEVGKYDDADEQVNATVLVHGFVRKDRLTNAEALNSELIYVVNQ